MTTEDLHDAVSVLVVDDHPIVRRGLVTLLSGEPWVRQVYEASTADVAVKEAVLHSADVVVMDLRLGTDDGVKATSRILTARPSTVVVVVTMVADPDQVARALAAGARGYVLKTSSPTDIIAALQLTWKGGLVLGSGLGPAMLRQPTEAKWPAPFDRLTESERELARHLAHGESNARISRALGVTDKTVRNRVSSLLVKLGVADRVAAVIAARQAGLDSEPIP